MGGRSVGGSSSTTWSPRFTVDFDRLRMTVPSGDAGYAEVEAPLAQVLAKTIANAREPKPILLWVYSTMDGDAMDACDDHLRADEEASLCVDRFRRYRLDVETIRSEKIREELGETPAYLYFDPAGNEIARVSGERASDCRAFEHALEKAWRAVFETNRQRYLKTMTKVLDEKAEIEKRRTELAAERAELDDRPNPRRERAIEKKSEAVEKDFEKILEVERETRNGVTLKEEFRKDSDEVVEKN